MAVCQKTGSRWTETVFEDLKSFTNVRTSRVVGGSSQESLEFPKDRAIRPGSGRCAQRANRFVQISPKVYGKTSFCKQNSEDLSRIAIGSADEMQVWINYCRDLRLRLMKLSVQDLEIRVIAKSRKCSTDYLRQPLLSDDCNLKSDN